MTDQSDPSALIAQLQQQLAGMGQAPAMPMQPAAPTITAVGVPIKIQTPDGGNIKINLMLPPEAAANPQALLMVLQQLQGQGWPLDIWYPKPQQSGGGWNQGGGGYNRGGYGRGGRW